MSEELDVLQIVTHRLTLAQIPYMVTGSMAMNFYAMPRMTRDIDFVVELTKPDIDRMIKQFHQDFYIERDMIQQAIQQQTMFNLIHMPTVIKVDCIIRKDTSYRREEFSRRQSVNIEGHPLTIVAPEDLILSKLEWAKDTRSEIQMEDVRNLLRTVARLDQAYLKQWATVLGLQAILQELNQ